ncbi:Di-copper centre-containing protein [Xylaria castorea]|nr:Di-copper centre-containing protein [Xylaria castorea]
MLLNARAFTLYLATAVKIGHATAQGMPVPVIGMTTGIDQVTEKLPLRMNINTLEQEGGPMWDLLIRGLDALQNKPEDDERSHFAIAGIHGMPYAPYNGVGPVSGGSWGGYCPHQSPQLISWHRAFLVLYEQTLGDEVQRLALEYTNDDASAYREASQKLRLPYWDWASDPTLPPASTQENITVNGPDGVINLHNPLYSYLWQTYPLNETQFPGQGGMGPETTRHEGGTDMTKFIKDSVYRTFSSATTYDEMASMAGSGSSFESPHNAIHNYVGGSFLNLDLTSFDTLFMLHHCNLDRLSAMWTASHHDTLQAQPFTSQGLYSTAEGEIITVDSPLKPFYQADGRTFHTGRTVATTEAFGYTYPDMIGDDQGRKEVIVQINNLYGDLSATENWAAASTSRREWFTEIQVDRADLPLPCNIDVYLGDQLAGRVSLLRMPRTGIAYDELSLSQAVRSVDAYHDESGGTERRLINDLHVKVTKGDTTLDLRDITSLHINVISEYITPPSSETEFPSYNNRTTATVIIVPNSDILATDIDRHAKPNVLSSHGKFGNSLALPLPLPLALGYDCHGILDGTRRARRGSLPR